MKRTINEHSLNTIVEDFVNRYRLNKDERLVDYEWYVDRAKGKVFIITYIDKKK